MAYKQDQLPRHTDRVAGYETQSLAACDAPALEAEIASLVTEIGNGPRHTDGDRWDTAQNVRADQALECAAAISDPDLEHRPWTADIRVNDGERVSAGSLPIAQKTRTALVLAVLSGTLAVAWIAGSFSFNQLSSFIEPKLQPLGQIFGPDLPPTIGSPEAKATRPVLETDKSTTSASVHPSALTDVQIQPTSVKTYPVRPQSTRSSKLRAPEFGRRPKMSPRPRPFPETKPATIEGWTVRNVVDATAILEGPGGLWRAKPGDPVPGVGRVESIVRWGDRWIVATSGGLVSSP